MALNSVAAAINAEANPNHAPPRSDAPATHPLRRPQPPPPQPRRRPPGHARRLPRSPSNSAPLPRRRSVRGRCNGQNLLLLGPTYT